MKKHVLFIHGAGEGAYEEDRLLAASLVELYAASLPQAVLRAVDGRGHQLGNDLADVAEDIIRL